VIRERLSGFHRQTKLLVDYYHQRNLFSMIEGLGTIDEVFAKLVAVLNKMPGASGSLAS
jgi:adenylate kinase family enzyme